MIVNSLKKIYAAGYRFTLFYRIVDIIAGKDFSLRCLHPLTITKQLIIQKILLVNFRATWPVHWTSQVTSPKKIIPGNRGFGLSPGIYINGQNGIIIEENVLIGPGARIISSNHNILKFEEHVPSEPIIIRKNSWVGANAVILPGVELGEHTIVAAGSVVTKSFLQTNVIIGGVPARVLKQIPPYGTSTEPFNSTP